MPANMKEYKKDPGAFPGNVGDVSMVHPGGHHRAAELTGYVRSHEDLGQSAPGAAGNALQLPPYPASGWADAMQATKKL